VCLKVLNTMIVQSPGRLLNYPLSVRNLAARHEKEMRTSGMPNCAHAARVDTTRWGKKSRAAVCRAYQREE